MLAQLKTVVLIKEAIKLANTGLMVADNGPLYAYVDIS
jgi:hypothetical protein